MGFKDYVAGAAGGTLGFIGANVPGAIVGGYYGYKASKYGLRAAGKEFGTRVANRYLPYGSKLKVGNSGKSLLIILEWLILASASLVVLLFHGRLFGRIGYRLRCLWQHRKVVPDHVYLEEEYPGDVLVDRGVGTKGEKSLLNIKVQLKVLQRKVFGSRRKRLPK